MSIYKKLFTVFFFGRQRISKPLVGEVFAVLFIQKLNGYFFVTGCHGC
jgi:hypothetical protein